MLAVHAILQKAETVERAAGATKASQLTSARVQRTLWPATATPHCRQRFDTRLPHFAARFEVLNIP
jgi:hypothetical protein